MVNKLKRHSVSGQLPVHLEQSLLDSQFSDTTEEEADGHPYYPTDSTSPSRYGSGSRIERAVSFDVSTPRGRKRLWRRKRRCSNTKEEVGPATLNPDMMDSKQALLPPPSPPSQSPPPNNPLLPQQQTTPLRESIDNKEVSSHPPSGESTPQPSQTHESPITAEGDFSPAVAEFLESVKHPTHMLNLVRRSSSNGSLRTHRRQGSTGSTHSYRNPSSHSGSPVKGPSQCNSTSSLSKSRRAPTERVSSRRGSGSTIPYSKLDSSSSGEEDKEHETGTQSSDHNTTGGEQPLIARLRSAKSQANETQNHQTMNHSSGRDVYSNESSGDTRCSDGGHDADGESDVNSLDHLSELEPNETNESNLESLHSPPSNVESVDLTSTTPDILESESTSSLIPELKDLTLHSQRHTVATLITQFETTSSDSSLSNHGSTCKLEQPEIPLHIQRNLSVPLAGSYSPKAIEDILEGG